MERKARVQRRAGVDILSEGGLNQLPGGIAFSVFESVCELF